MELAPGVSINKIGKKLMAEFAMSRGQTPEEFTAEMKAKSTEPEFLTQMLSQSVPTERQVAMYRRYLVARDWARNIGVFAYNWTVGWVQAPASYSWSHVPPNGPSLTRFLFDVGAIQAVSHDHTQRAVADGFMT